MNKTVSIYFCKDSIGMDKTDDGKKFKIARSDTKSEIENIFGLENAPIDEEKFKALTTGEGQEARKIVSLISSSLQALLIFYSVSKENPIIINNTKYTESYFEYKNKVINSPSSIDVVLVSEDGESILFIESKLMEPIYDVENNEIGVTYFSNNVNGYKNKLQLEYEDLLNIGFICPCLKDEYGNVSADNISGKGMIAPIKNNTFVYSYGIKQMLSHLIGILNFEHPTGNCSKYLNARKFKHTYFMTVYNKLPNFNMLNAQLKLKNFVYHLEAAKNTVMEKPNIKNNIENIFITAYQDLYKDNSAFFGKDYMKNIIKYYKLSEV